MYNPIREFIDRYYEYRFLRSHNKLDMKDIRDVKKGIDPIKVQEFIDRFRENDNNEGHISDGKVREKLFKEAEEFYGKDFSYVWFQLILGALKKNNNGMYYDDAVILAQNWHTLLAEKAIPLVTNIDKFKNDYLHELSKYVKYIFGGDMFCDLNVKSELTDEQLNFLKGLPNWRSGSKTEELINIINKGTPLDNIMNEFIKTCQ